tara:strand:+ start:8941 stop:9954 length:1014 start_codon:yes stop_codon:yes gene_type:complete
MNNNYKQIVKVAHSNIAFVKYWGKRGRQYPLNPSVSMLIDQCQTKTQCSYQISDQLQVESFQFEGKEQFDFGKRIEQYLESISEVYPLAKRLRLRFESENNFPHSAGIASSASGFAAIANILAEIEWLENNVRLSREQISTLARLGSGSACRSISKAPFNLWGKTKFDLGTDDYSLDLDEKKYSFSEKLADTILVVNQSQKDVSSSFGHSLMNTHFYRESRIEQAHENTRCLLNAIEADNFTDFGEIIENEALSLHAMMMTSMPSYTLLHANTLRVIEKLKDSREKGEIMAYFTLDAGPNIHLIYPESQKDQVKSFVSEFCLDLCEKIIWAPHFGES